MMVPIPKRYPVFLNLLQIRFPIGALVSITHRVSGVALALAAPVFVYLFTQSLADESSYRRVAWLLAHYPCRGIAAATVVFLVFHLQAGIRHLLMDVGIGTSLLSARRMAWIVGATTAVFALAVVVEEVGR